MKQKSSKLNKLEKNRYSVFYKDFEACCYCGSIYNITKHEIFEGRNRRNSMKYGYVLPLCSKCHSQLQNNNDFNIKWKVLSQKHFEEKVGNRDDFIKIFRRNYF